MAECMKETGLTTKCMGKESTFGQMVEDTKEITIWIKSRVMGHTIGLMEEYTRGIGKKDSSMEKVDTHLSRV